MGTVEAVDAAVEQRKYVQLHLVISTADDDDPRPIFAPFTTGSVGSDILPSSVPKCVRAVQQPSDFGFPKPKSLE